MLGFPSISLPREPQGDGVERGLDEKSQLRHVDDSLSFSFLICKKGSWGQGAGFPLSLLSSLILYSPGSPRVVPRSAAASRGSLL